MNAPCGVIRSHRTAGRHASAWAAAVELAIVLPLLMLLVLAAVDVGRVVFAYLSVSNAARSGAAYGAMHGFTPYTYSSWAAQIDLVIQQEMQGVPGFVQANLNSTISTTTDADGLFQLQVGVIYPFATIVNWPGLPTNIVLQRQVEMRQIR